MELEANRIANHLLAVPPNSTVSKPSENILRSANASSTTAEGGKIAPASVARALSNSGHPLDQPLQQEMAQRFRHDFSRVRVHCDDDADQSARDVNAHAYTVGHDIVFAASRFAPNTLEGRRLLAHELVHVVQQRNDSGLTSFPRRIARQAPPAPPAPARAPLNWRPTINTALGPFAARRPLVTEDQKLAIETLDAPPEGMWANLDWGKVSVSAAERILNPTLIHQRVLGVCGPAAALNAEALLSPRSYADLVVKVFHTGKVGDKAVNETLRRGTALAVMDQSDWMLLSAIQDVNNRFYSYYGRHDEGEEKHRASHTTGQVEDDMKATGCVATTTYPCYISGEIDEATKASRLLRDHPAVIEVVIFLKAAPLQNPAFQKTAGRPGDPISKGSPTHFVRLTEAMTFTPDDVTFKAFTWGAVNPYTFSISNFQRLVSAFVVGSRDKTIKL